MTRAITGCARRPTLRLPDARAVAVPDEHDTKATLGDRARDARVAQPLAWHRRRDRLRAGDAERHAADDAPATDLPCEVETVMSARCWTCHGEKPTTVGIPSLTSVAAFMAPSRMDPSQSIGAVALITHAVDHHSDAAAALDGGDRQRDRGDIRLGRSRLSHRQRVQSDLHERPDLAGGNEGSPNMNPGMACIQCHAASDEGPRFSIAGTIYPTVHEPDLCDGAPPASGAQVIITGADGRTLTLAPNAAGNFYSERGVASPYRAKVVTAAGERAMTAQQTSGDCNSCHSLAGANGAPGRIMLP